MKGKKSSWLHSSTKQCFPRFGNSGVPIEIQQPLWTEQDILFYGKEIGLRLKTNARNSKETQQFQIAGKITWENRRPPNQQVIAGRTAGELWTSGEQRENVSPFLFRCLCFTRRPSKSCILYWLFYASICQFKAISYFSKYIFMNSINNVHNYIFIFIFK